MARIIVFSERFWPEGGGGELATYLILKLLASARDFEIEVHTGTERPMHIPGASIKTAGFLKATNKVQLFLNIMRNKHYVEKAVEEADVVYIPRFSYPVIPLAKKHNKKVIVHLHDYQPVSYTAVILSTEVDRPLGDFRRTLMLESKASNMPRAIASALATPLTRAIRRWVGTADKIICVSRRHEEIILKLAPEYRGKTVVVYNPPPEVPGIEKNLSEEPILLYTGGDSYVKGFYVLLEALRALGRRKRTNFRLILTNNHSQKSLGMIDNLKKKYDLDIKVLGRISYNELIKLHSEAWALIFPSIWKEPLPYTIMEAVLLGTIPIATRVGGVPEIVSGTSAELFLVEAGDARSLASKILELTSLNKEEVLSIGRTLKRNASINFDKELTKRTLVEVFTQ